MDAHREHSRIHLARSRWRDQGGLEGIEVALITGLVVVSILAAIPVVAGGVQTAIEALADLLADAGAGID